MTIGRTSIGIEEKEESKVMKKIKSFFSMISRKLKDLLIKLKDLFGFLIQSFIELSDWHKASAFFTFLTVLMLFAVAFKISSWWLIFLSTIMILTMFFSLVAVRKEKKEKEIIQAKLKEYQGPDAVKNLFNNLLLYHCVKGNFDALDLALNFKSVLISLALKGYIPSFIKLLELLGQDHLSPEDYKNCWFGSFDSEEDTQIELMSFLHLNNLVDKNVKNQFEETARHVAVRRKRWKLINFLNQIGQDPTITNNKGKRADQLVKSEDVELINALIMPLSENQLTPDPDSDEEVVVNEGTFRAIQELEEGKGERFDDTDALLKDLRKPEKKEKKRKLHLPKFLRKEPDVQDKEPELEVPVEPEPAEPEVETPELLETPEPAESEVETPELLETPEPAEPEVETPELLETPEPAEPEEPSKPVERKCGTCLNWQAEDRERTTEAKCGLDPVDSDDHDEDDVCDAWQPVPESDEDDDFEED